MSELVLLSSVSTWLAGSVSVGFVLGTNVVTGLVVGAIISYLTHRRHEELIEVLMQHLEAAERTEHTEHTEHASDAKSRRPESVSGVVHHDRGSAAASGPRLRADGDDSPAAMAALDSDDDDADIADMVSALGSLGAPDETAAADETYGGVTLESGLSEHARPADANARESAARTHVEVAQTGSRRPQALLNRLGLGAPGLSAQPNWRRAPPGASDSGEPNFLAPPFPAPPVLRPAPGRSPARVDSLQPPVIDPGPETTLRGRAAPVPEVGAPRVPWSPVPEAGERTGANAAVSSGSGQSGQSIPSNRSNRLAASDRVLPRAAHRPRSRLRGEPETIEPDSMIAPTLLAGALRDPSVGNLVGSYHGLEAAVDNPELNSEISQSLLAANIKLDDEQENARLDDAAYDDDAPAERALASALAAASGSHLRGQGQIAQFEATHAPSPRLRSRLGSWLFSAAAVAALAAFCLWAYEENLRQSENNAVELERARAVERRARAIGGAAPEDERSGTSSRVSAPSPQQLESVRADQSPPAGSGDPDAANTDLRGGSVSVGTRREAAQPRAAAFITGRDDVAAPVDGLKSTAASLSAPEAATQGVRAHDAQSDTPSTGAREDVAVSRSDRDQAAAQQADASEDDAQSKVTDFNPASEAEVSPVNDADVANKSRARKSRARTDRSERRTRKRRSRTRSERAGELEHGPGAANRTKIRLKKSEDPLG